MTSAEETVPKTKSVPQWNGDATVFQSYEEAAMTWELETGPRLQAELQGPAKRLVAGKPPSWLSFNGGVAELLKFLLTGLVWGGRSSRSSWSTSRSSSRTPGEERVNQCMSISPGRSSQQSLLRVLPHYSKKKARMPGSTSMQEIGELELRGLRVVGAAGLRSQNLRHKKT